MAGAVCRWITALRERLRRRGELLLELIVLRHQLAVLQRTGTRRPCFRPGERLFWVLLSRWWADWRRGLIIVQPATVLRWRRQGLRSLWVSGSRGRWRGGRPTDRPRDPCPYHSDEPREFSVGRAADPWGTAQTRVRRVAGHGVPLHATAELSALAKLAHLPAEPGPWDRCDRSWRSRSDIRPASYSRLRVDRADCPMRQQGAGWHLLQAYRTTGDLAPVEAISLFQSC